MVAMATYTGLRISRSLPPPAAPTSRGFYRHCDLHISWSLPLMHDHCYPRRRIAAPCLRRAQHMPARSQLRHGRTVVRRHVPGRTVLHLASRRCPMNLRSDVRRSARRHHADVDAATLVLGSSRSDAKCWRCLLATPLLLLSQLTQLWSSQLSQLWFSLKNTHHAETQKTHTHTAKEEDQRGFAQNTLPWCTQRLHFSSALTASFSHSFILLK